MSTSFPQPLLLWILVAILTYFIGKEIWKATSEPFVPYNAFEAPNTQANDVHWNAINEKFGNLVQAINTTNFALAYELDSLIDTFQAALHQISPQRYKIVSIQDTKPFTLLNVTLMDTQTDQTLRLKRVDYIVSSLNPFLIENIIVTPEDNNTIQAQDTLASPSTFRIKNSLGLFYPYPTSYNDTILSQTAVQAFLSGMNTPSS